MATSPTSMPDPSQSATPDNGGGASASSSSQSPMQDQASQMQQLLANWYQAAKQMAAADPRLASGMEKVAQGIQEAQTALVSPPQSASLGQQPTY